MADQANTPTWQQSAGWEVLARSLPLAALEIAQHAALVAVAADRAHLAALIEALPRTDIAGLVRLDMVLALLRDTP